MWILSLILCVALVSARDTLRNKKQTTNLYSYNQYIKDFDKVVGEDFALRKGLFDLRMEQMRRHNADTTKTWKLAVNKFFDRTPDELKSLRGLRKNLKTAYRMESDATANYNEVTGPVNVDWRTKGVVTDVKNPNGCGGTGGCEGGTVELAYARIIVMGGLSTEASYPYQGVDESCESSQLAPLAKISSYVNLPSNTLAPMLNHIVNNGPIAISVDASSWSFYGGGVFDGCDQTNPDLDHAVQLVGAGTDPSDGDYWLVRNSWGADWGENGYIRLRRTTQLRCGIDTSPQDGDGCNGGPPNVTVCGTCGILYDGVYPVVKK